MLLIRYDLPVLEVEFPAPGATETLELLVREPAPALGVRGLQPIDVVALDAESTYRRYSGTDVRDAVVRLEEESEGGLPSMGLFAALLAALLGGVGLLAHLRPRGSAADRVSPGLGAAPASALVPITGRDGLILQVARLDESLEAITEPDVRRTMLYERTRLMARLRGES